MLCDSIYICSLKDKILEIKSRLVIAQQLGVEGREGGRCSYKRVAQVILVAMVLFCILILAANIYISSHVTKLYRTNYTHTHTHINTSKTGEI